MVPDDSLRRYILECDLGNYYFYYLYIHVHFIKHVSFLYISEDLRDFIKCNVSFLCISKYPRDFIKCNASFLCILEYPHELHDVQQAKVELMLNQPIYVGFAILDLLKTLMHYFHYSNIKRMYADSTLLFINTDSLTYQIQTDNVYKDFYADKLFFNFLGTRRKSILQW